MRKLYFLLALCLLFSANGLYAQKKTVTFVGQNANSRQYIKLSKVVITNRTANWSETIVYPDTTMVLTYETGIADKDYDNGFGLNQNRPNPFQGTTDVALEVSKAGKVTLELFDALGRRLESLSLSEVQPGQHNFRVQVANAGIYFLTAQQNGHSATVKMIARSADNGDHIAYTGMEAARQNLKDGAKGEINKPYKDGDELSFQGFANVNGKEIASITIISKIINTETIALPFIIEGDKFICGTSLAFDIDGNCYNTVQINDQCWMKENLRTTKLPDGTDIELTTSMSRTEPYRYIPNNKENTVALAGYLYNWAAVMNGSTTTNTIPSGVQGICPDGWHVPSDSEYLKMLDYVASVEEYLCDQKEDENGPHIAAALCYTELWSYHGTPCCPGVNPESNNATGFSIVPAGCYYNNIQGYRSNAYLWTTSDKPSSWQEDAYNIFINFGLPFIQNGAAMTDAGYSVRCLRD